MENQKTGHYVPNSLLSISADSKTVKGEELGFLTGILYLAPHTIAGPNLCANSLLAACRLACLYSAGRGAFSNVQAARINKTRFYHEDRQGFMNKLAWDIAKAHTKAKRATLELLVRLNGTSDNRWERQPVTLTPKTVKRLARHGFTVSAGTYANIFAVFPDIQFYDYTKLANRRGIPANYDLTFSYSGAPAYQSEVNKAIAAGMRIATVFRSRDAIPQNFLGLPVISGDDSDVRHIDPQGVIVALYAKGAARKDRSGFVVDTARQVIPLMTA